MCRPPQAVRPWTERPIAPLDRDGRRSEVCTDPVPGPHAYHQRPPGEVASPGSGESAASCSAPAGNRAQDAEDELHLLYKKQPGREHTTDNATTNSPISAPAAPTMAAVKIVHLSGSNIERDLVSDVAGSNQAKLACPFDG